MTISGDVIPDPIAALDSLQALLWCNRIRPIYDNQEDLTSHMCELVIKLEPAQFLDRACKLLDQETAWFKENRIDQWIPLREENSEPSGRPPAKIMRIKPCREWRSFSSMGF